MSDKEEKVENKNDNSFSFRLLPFTGPFFAIWAFFGPDSFATWWGTIVGTAIHIVREKGGF